MLFPVRGLGPVGGHRGGTSAPSTLLDSLLAYWKLEEASGNRVDAQNSNDLTPTNTPGNTTGKVGNACLLVRASSQRLSIASLAFPTNADFTWGGWFKFTSTTGANQVLLGKQITTGSRQTLIYLDTTASRITHYYEAVGGGSHGLQASTFGAPSAGVWYFVMGRWTQSTTTLEISVNDGTKNSLVTGTTPASQNPGQFNIGATFAAALLDGAADEVGVWTRKLTDAEITEWYDKTSAGLRL
jgi:hypothetical protein